MVCRGVKAGPARIRTAVQAGNGVGPSQAVPVKRQSSRIANPVEREEVEDARKFTGATYRAKGIDYNVQDLASLFTAVTGNPRITTAILQNRASGDVRTVSTAIRAFADGLPHSNLVAANLGGVYGHTGVVAAPFRQNQGPPRAYWGTCTSQSPTPIRG